MVEISDETYAELVRAGILTEEGSISPNAHIPRIQRQKIQKQCESPGIRLMYRRPSKIQWPKGKPINWKMETDVGEYLVRQVGGFYDAGEGYWILNLLKWMIEGFEPRRKKLSFPIEEFDSRLKIGRAVTEVDIAAGLEEVFTQSVTNAVDSYSEPLLDVTPAALRRRWRSAVTERWKSESDSDYQQRFNRFRERRDSGERSFLKRVDQHLVLFRSIPEQTWARLASVVTRNWSSMSSGWPDITLVNRDGGLRLIEVKKSDKLHGNQIYVLKKLVHVLGTQRVFVLKWAGILHNPHVDDYSRHLEMTTDWLRGK